MTNHARPDDEQPAYPGSTRRVVENICAHNEPVGTQEENLPGQRVPRQVCVSNGHRNGPELSSSTDTTVCLVALFLPKDDKLAKVIVQC